MKRGSAEEIKMDLAVIGSGVSGLASAVIAAQGGLKVILFEKQQSMGGSSNFFEGIFAVESDMQRERYIDYTRDQAFKNIMEYSHWRADARLVRAIVDESAGSIRWLQSLGIEFTDATINMPGAPQTYHVVKGEAVIKQLATKAKELGVVLRLGVPVKSVLREGGPVSGVIVEENGTDTDIKCKSVMIASGGYANNREWIKKYAGFDLGVNIFPLGNVDKMGDGIRMAWEAGAEKGEIGVLEMLRIAPFGPQYPMKNHVEFVAIQPDLWINPQGERFCDEGIAFFDTSVGNANARFKEGHTYSIFDDTIKEDVIRNGTTRGVGFDVPPGTHAVNFAKDLDFILKIGGDDVFMADSIEDLAEKIKVDPNTLKSTIEEYNRFCEKGHDDLFAKNPKYLRPLKGPKFYAVKARTVFLGSMGGIKINHKMEVVDKKGNVVQGLYAGGMDASGMWGDSYCMNPSSGLSSAFALNSGVIAGKNVLEYLGK
ncbi:MAG: FAD-dependent oxidoreductase [Deltaproteobacteria bacterium]|nr:FAD-dependent oxidoreductase [Deltaproteobacteria bacterium]